MEQSPATPVTQNQEAERTILVPASKFKPAAPPAPVMDGRMGKVIRQQHDGFMARYQVLVERNVHERHYARVQTQARIRLVAEIFKNAGVITDFNDVDIVRYSQSVVMAPSIGDYPVYLLNDCYNVIAASGTLVGQDPFTARLMVANQNTKESFYLKAADVLEDGFDWTAFASQLLNEMHEMVYSQEQAMRDIFDRSLV